MIALRMLKTRERFPAEIDRKLEQKGFDKPKRDAVIDWLTGRGLLSEGRATELLVNSRTGKSIRSDAAVMHKMETLGATDEAKAQARGMLAGDDELSRARRLLSGRAARARSPEASARWLASKGFSEETIGLLFDLEGERGG